MSKLGSADIASLLRREIARGTFRQHERLPASRQMAETYGVARNTLREALIQLEREGLITTRPGSGTYVTHEPGTQTIEAVQNANPLELIDARFALEPHICRLCVLHGRQADFEELEALCDQMEEAVEDPRAFAEADTDFHRALATSTNNNLLIWVIGQINSVRAMDEWTRMRHLTLNPDIIRQYNIQHRAILDAIRARTPEEAATRMKEHLETARLSLTRAANA
ncbi:FadR family transcriptional regulator [Roseovarius sp. SCSIO 43702]|uniref:FadR/GntR family transcriptional regulator n=1 Tax=Roseovarius sp. SCSIO 43702 TaxID=2823043 RepID=UPI001C734420|nr:FadR/GntR family transcriptional regulator [Roseovarius sp. SCSIO 43702]QYX55256.1 FadR family transcriptional regulator [Roseovarius sp. SCSIO 43702]